MWGKSIILMYRIWVHPLIWTTWTPMSAFRKKKSLQLITHPFYPPKSVYSSRGKFSLLLILICAAINLSLGFGWVGVGGFSKVVATFNHVGGSFNLFYGRHRGCVNNPIVSNLGLCAACWAHFTCHHELWPTSVSHSFSFLNSSLGLAGGKHYQKITIPVFRRFFKFFLFQVTFLIFFCIAIFSHYYLLVGLLLQYVALFQSGN